MEKGDIVRWNDEFFARNGFCEIMQIESSNGAMHDVKVLAPPQIIHIEKNPRSWNTKTSFLKKLLDG